MKRNVLIVLVAMFTSLISVVLINEKNRKEILARLTDLKRSIQLKNNHHFPIRQAGDPFADNVENSKMVSEGSQYGVDYYNRVKQ